MKDSTLAWFLAGAPVAVVGCHHGETVSTVVVPVAPVGKVSPVLTAEGSGLAVTTGGFLWEQRRPQGEDLASVWGTAPDDVWAVGRAGACVHWDGHVLEGRPVPTSDDLAAVWGTARDDVWAAGMQGLFHWDGHRWSVSYRGTDLLNLHAVWGRSARDVWAVGGFDNTGSVVLHFDGGGWQSIETPFSESLRSVWGTPNGSISVFGPDGIVRTYDGKGWTAAAPKTPDVVRVVPTASGLLGIAGDSPGNGAVFRFDGTRWTPEPTPIGLIYAVWADPNGRAFVVGLFGKIAYFDGHQWIEQEAKFARNDDRPRLQSVFALSPTDAWAVGVDGAIVHYDGRSWSEVSSGPAGTYQSATRVGADDVWVVGGHIGRGGDLLRKKAGHWTWTPVPAPGETYHALAAPAPDDVWLAGSKDLYHGNGTSFWGVVFHDVPGDTSMAAFHDVCAVDGEVFAVGWSAVVRLAGEEVIERDLSLRQLEAVWGATRDDVWAAGARGALRHFDGNGWSDYPTPADAYWYGLWGTAGDDVWLVGVELTQLMGAAVIAHFDGQRFTVERPPKSAGLRAVFGRARNDVWAVGALGTALHFDGKAWSPVPTGVGMDLLGGLVEPDGTVWLTGRSAILRRPPH